MENFTICTNAACGFAIQTDAVVNYCCKCGAAAIAQCPHCHAAIRGPGMYCTYCGRHMGSQQTESA